MFLAFRMGPGTSGRGLCDVDRVLFRVTKSQTIGKSWIGENMAINRLFRFLL